MDTIDELLQRIYDASGHINDVTDLRYTRFVLKRARLCTQVNGGCLEQLLHTLNNVNILSHSQ